MIMHAGGTASVSCSLCQAGAYWTGSGQSEPRIALFCLTDQSAEASSLPFVNAILKPTLTFTFLRPFLIGSRARIIEYSFLQLCCLLCPFEYRMTPKKLLLVCLLTMTCFLNHSIWHAGGTASISCSLCQAGAYWTGSGQSETLITKFCLRGQSAEASSLSHCHLST